MTQRVLTTHVPVSLAKEVDSLATRLDRPRGWILKEALTLYVDLERKRYQLTLDALAEVDAGKTIPHDQVEAWARTLRRRKSR